MPDLGAALVHATTSGEAALAASDAIDELVSGGAAVSADAGRDVGKVAEAFGGQHLFQDQDLTLDNQLCDPAQPDASSPLRVRFLPAPPPPRISELSRWRDLAIARSISELTNASTTEAEARRLVEQLAIAWTASLLVQHGDHDVTETYLRSRLDNDWGSEFGTLPSDAPLGRIASRSIPAS